MKEKKNDKDDRECCTLINADEWESGRLKELELAARRLLCRTHSVHNLKRGALTLQACETRHRDSSVDLMWRL